MIDSATLLVAARWLAWLLGIYVLLGVLLYVFQRGLLYFPTPELAHPFSEITVTTENEASRVIVVNPGQRRGLLYFGGNAETVAGSASAYARALPDHTLYLVNYPGFGRSTGSPSEAGIFEVALGVYDQVARNHTSIDLVGRSLGSGVAIYLAGRREVHRLVLVTPYDSIRGLAAQRYPVYPIRWLLKDHYDSGSRVGSVTAPVLIIAAENDRVIPPWSTRLLASRITEEQLQTHWIRGAGHNDLATGEYYQRMREFLK